MKHKAIITNILIAFSLISCIDQFEIDEQQIESVLIIEGYINNTGEPALVWLSETNPNLNNKNYFEDSNRTVKNISKATVIISSDKQPTDTLIPDSSQHCFVSKKIQGNINETYNLKVIYLGKTYEASAFMPPAPLLDSLTFQRKQIEKENANLYVPMANFNDPADQENFYLFRDYYVGKDTLGNEYWVRRTGGDPWMISLFTDKFINGKASSLNIREGITVRDYWRDGNYWLFPNEIIGIQMEAITRETYDYYLALINQLKYAAGVFHPSPANAPTNITNGGQGFFYAASVSRKSIVVPNDN